MTIKLTLLFVASTISVVGQERDSTELVTYEGYYLQEYQENNHFEGFWQLELQMTQPENMPQRLVGKALIYVNALCDVSLEAFSISRDSLYIYHGTLYWRAL